ncbi:hypothetical protein [Yoonia sp. 2307UL14-13]|uniref:hypothetical protein n=1 Tax=Yoonia sp. 2307UL14-13 TaxID=3126506 RepID=UPI0030A8A380
MDGNGEISQEERAVHQGRNAVNVEVLFAQGDTDDNGMISLPEILAYAATQVDTTRRGSRYNHLMLFDLNDDGVVRIDEITASIGALQDGDPALPQPMHQSAVSNTVRCDAPEPPDKSEVVVLSAYEGAALSTVSIAGMDDETHVADIVIEDGDTPFYLFLAAYSNMIWNISGDIDRLDTVVVQRSGQSEDNGAGVIGIPSEKVHFVSRNSCIKPIHSIEGGEGIIAYRQVARGLGQDPDHMLAHYTVGTISLPSGEGSKEDGEGTDIIIYNGQRYTLGPDGPKIIDESEGQGSGDRPFGVGQVYRDLLRFSPGGIRHLDADNVVSPGDAQDYDVLPQQAGLLQLLLEEKIRYTPDGFYLISEPIARFPAGLAGAHSVKFMLAEGVPMPGGSPGHSSVYSAETGECVSGFRCR